MGEGFVLDFSFLQQLNDNPFGAMWFLFTHGGWIVFAILLLWMAREIWIHWRQELYEHKKEWMVLAIYIPRMTEQGPRAVENIFAHLAGAHQPASWTEKWIQGKTQDTLSVEIVSSEGQVQYFIHATRTFRDLIEASIYAQFPDAEIHEVEDYTKKFPKKYPNDEWDLFGTEMIPVKPDSYPIRTYPEFEDKLSGEFKDPLAVLLENFSRLGPGENAWYQIVLTPIDQKEFRAHGEALIKKLTAAPPQKKDAAGPHKMMILTPGEKKIIEAVENKISKIAYECKIRFIYVAKKEILKKSRIVQPFIGAIKQFNTNDMQSLKPESKRVGMNGTLWFFKDHRNNERKRRLMAAYKHRSNHEGMHYFALNIEELASLWHFPISMQVRAPQLKKTESKRSEPPINLPFG